MSKYDPITQSKARIFRRHPGKAPFIIPKSFINMKGTWVEKQFEATGKPKTMATDHFNIYYDEDFVNSLSPQELDFVILHEGEHIALMHSLRLGKRDPLLWNVSADFSLNDGLETIYIPGIIELWKRKGYKNWSDEAPKCPKQALLDKKYTYKMGAEKIYNKLLDQQQQQQGDGQSQSGNGNGDNFEDMVLAPQQGQGESNEEYEERITKAMESTAIEAVRAAKMAKDAGLLTADMEWLIKDLSEPKVDWRQQLALYMTQIMQSYDDYTWKKRNRRYGSFDFALPAYSGETLPPIYIGFDTSGSMSLQDQKDGAAEVEGILNTFNTEATFVYTDYGVAGTETFTSEDSPIKLTPKGGGGTSFKPFFKWVEEQDRQPAFVLYFTDLYGGFPEIEPDYPVLWVTKTRGYNVPFGETVHIDE